jgi:hypothetical protein
MATATTKAQLAEALEAATSRISELEALLAAQGEQQQPTAAAHLDQVLWIQRKPLAERTPDGKGNIGYTRSGMLTVRFAAQYASLDKRSGNRTFGAWKFFTAYGEVAQQVIDLMRTEDRLVRVQAYEEPWSSTQDPNARNSDWVVRGFNPIGRGAGTPPELPPVPAKAAPAAAPAAAAPAQPQLAQVAF